MSLVLALSANFELEDAPGMTKFKLINIFGGLFVMALATTTTTASLASISAFARPFEAWKQNVIFQKDSHYKRILDADLTFQQVARKYAQASIEGRFSGKKQQLKFLDIACGTDTPRVPNLLFTSLAAKKFTFDYTGVDINESLREVTHFDFPQSAIRQTLIQGDAYDLTPGMLPHLRFDIIYSGLNFHHLSPEELSKVVSDCAELLEDDGILLIHDLVRPDGSPQEEKPESKFQIGNIVLSNFPRHEVFKKRYSNTPLNWKAKHVALAVKSMREAGMNENEISDVKSHIESSDFLFSLEEIEAVLKTNSFDAQTVCFDNVHPEREVSKFFGFVVAAKKGTLNFSLKNAELAANGDQANTSKAQQVPS